MANIRIFLTSWESKIYNYSLYMYYVENLANYELNFYELKPTGVLYGDRQDETYLKDNVLAVDYKLTNTKYSSQNRMKIQINDYDLSDPNFGDNYYRFFYKEILPLPILHPLDPFQTHRYMYLLERRQNCYDGQDLINNELYVSFFDIPFTDNLFSKYRFSSPLYDSGSHLRFTPFPTHFTHAFIVHIDDILSNDFRGRLFVYDGVDVATPPSGANFYGFKTLTPQIVGTDVWQDIGGLGNNLEYISSNVWTEFNDISQLNLYDNNCNYVSTLSYNIYAYKLTNLLNYTGLSSIYAYNNDFLVYVNAYYNTMQLIFPFTISVSPLAPALNISGVLRFELEIL